MFHRFHTGTWQRCPSGRVPTRFIPVRVARATVTMAVLRICVLLLLFDCQEAFHCCLVVACINRINMISIECHRSGERCPGKREFDNRIEINRVRSGEIMWLFPLRKSRNLFLAVSLFLSVYVYVSRWLSPCLSLSVSASFCLFFSISVCLSLSLSLSLSL